eukprot:s3184_g1.t1
MLNLFKTVCPQFVEHRWEYLYETLDWVAPRKSALELLKLRDFSNAAAERDNPSQNEQHQLSSKHLELLTNLCDDGSITARRFWAMCGLTKILSDWGHHVSGYLHGCPCHDVGDRPKKKQRRRKDVEFLERKEEELFFETCPMAGRMAVPLAAGYPKIAMQGDDRLRVAGHNGEGPDLEVIWNVGERLDRRRRGLRGREKEHLSSGYRRCRREGLAVYGNNREWGVEAR